jgi:hypothetical protein
MTEDGILKKEFETKQRTPKRKKEGRTWEESEKEEELWEDRDILKTWGLNCAIPKFLLTLTLSANKDFI